MRIYGNSQSGNCLKVKWICEALALAYEWVEIDSLHGATRTPQFLAMNSAGQVPVVRLDDGRLLAQSNAILRYLARGSRFIPQDAYAQAKMDEWLFWEQYSHEPNIAVCRFHMRFLGRAASEREPERVQRGEAALARMEQHLASSRYLIREDISLADISLVAYTRVADEGGFDLTHHAALRRWIADCEAALRLA
jgi:glutathione S-transferase